ncbi:ComEC/Rec2 family competence protein, partial [Candidatus Kaiserbacteria bacterium]|nr:ComEC/Rec2 family competence protein [Candidatus Kaiserbacteria bacterium]
LLLALGVGLVWRRNSEDVSAPYLLITSLVLFASSLGILRTEIASWQFNKSPLEFSLGQPVMLEGVVVQEPDYREKTVHLYIKTDDDLILATADHLSAYSYGDRVIVSGKLEKPKEFETDLGRTFDYPGYLKAKGVEYNISFAEVEVVDSGEANPIIAGLLYTKHRFIDSLEQIIPQPAVGLGEGLLLGVKSALGEDIEQDFRRTGIIHIVVLSGYNVMLVVAFIMFCFSFLLPVRYRVVFGVLAIVCFALIVGLSATVVRASIMAGLVLLAQVLGRRYDVMRALLLTGVVMVCVNPYILVYDIGFQLSFMATLGLLLIVPEFESTVIRKKSRPGWREFFLATVSTQIAVCPLLMYHIGEVSLIAVLVNVLVLPMVAPAMLLTFSTGLLGLVSTSLAGIIGYVSHISLSYILLVAKWFAMLPFATVTIPEFSFGVVVVLYGLMMSAWYYFKTKKNSKSSLSDWTIVEETESVGGQISKTPPGSPVDSDLPIFFR